MGVLLLALACDPQIGPDGRHAEALSGLVDSDAVVLEASLIEDRLVRAGAVQEWVEANRESLTPDEAKAVCDVLQEPDDFQCWRLYSSAHLR